MANIDGVWDTLAQTPMGEQNARMTIVSDGNRFTASSTGSMGTIDINDGTISGDQISWTMEVDKPMPLSVQGEAQVNGDVLEGTLSVGMFGSFPLSGKRAS